MFYEAVGKEDFAAVMYVLVWRGSVMGGQGAGSSGEGRGRGDKGVLCRRCRVKAGHGAERRRGNLPSSVATKVVTMNSCQSITCLCL